MLPGDTPQKLVPRPRINYTPEEPLAGVNLDQLFALMRGEIDDKSFVVQPYSSPNSSSAWIMKAADDEENCEQTCVSSQGHIAKATIADSASDDSENVSNQSILTSMPPSCNGFTNNASPLIFLPGAFVYRDHTEELGGKRLQVLKAFARAKGGRLTLDSLRDHCWGGGADEPTIRSAVKGARDALRRAIKTVGSNCDQDFDPIKCVDKGSGRTAWRLDLP